MHLIEKKCEFSQSCSDIQLHGTVLSATCINNNHQAVRSSVDLDDCVMNNRGTAEEATDQSSFLLWRSLVELIFFFLVCVCV
ncbi:hypothetical protein KP509_18G073800 [Ceratopteris richardii]|uniref:Cyanovirin-N domain-containing protein n=1 Tax=Ceratopteris richardii TaxID=49495 RepID=A0A8T2SQT3_CERRI|nr:hypothetical protein KP509_18G073800 [Ceratopteris richardii]